MYERSTYFFAQNKRFGIPNAYWKYYIAYYIEGTVAIIKEWLSNDCQDPIETIATVIEECIRPLKGASGELDSEKYDRL
ncbi:MAG: TetR family transcriptional regulator C-terminal domain-containing protein [Lachnospiraceae bacterium]